MAESSCQSPPSPLQIEAGKQPDADGWIISLARRLTSLVRA